MIAKEIFFDFCKENGIFGLVQRKIKDFNKKNNFSLIKLLSEESFHRVLFTKGETNIFTYKLGYWFIKDNKDIKWKSILKKWSRFRRNNIFLKTPILKDGDTVEYYDTRYLNSVKNGIASFVDLDNKMFRCNLAVYNIGDIISVNGKKVPLDVFYIKQKGKIYGK